MAFPEKIILASASQARRALLEGAGVAFQVHVSGIDESEIKQALQDTPEDVALALALAKAQAVSGRFPEAFVIGSDQVLLFEGQIHDKATSREEALSKLRTMRGKEHFLMSAVGCVRAGKVLFQDQERCLLKMRAFSEHFLEAYAQENEETLLKTVGGYALEGAGIQFFENVQGSYFSILGLPLFPLLSFLRTQKLILE